MGMPLPVHERGEPPQSARRRLPARRARDQHIERHAGRPTATVSGGVNPGRRAHERRLPAWDHDRVRTVDSGPDDKLDNGADAFSAALSGLPGPGPPSTAGRWPRATSAPRSVPPTLTTTSASTPVVPGGVGRSCSDVGRHGLAFDHLQGRHELHGVAQAHGGRTPGSPDRRGQRPQDQGGPQDGGGGQGEGDRHGRTQADRADRPRSHRAQPVDESASLAAKLTVTQRIAGKDRTISTQGDVQGAQAREHEGQAGALCAGLSFH